MHATHAGEKRKPLQKMARRMLRAEAQGLKATARLEYLSVWQMEKIKDTKKGSRAYAYWMATWVGRNGAERPPGQLQKYIARAGAHAGQEDEGRGADGRCLCRPCTASWISLNRHR